MKNVIFEEVGMVNFGPYIEPMILKFQNNNITMLVGPNGVGKTMALDAIPFSLYGITSKGIKADEVVNNKIKKDCHTWVKFKVNSDVYEVNRYQKHKKHGNTAIITLNGVEIKKGHKEVVPEIERILCPSKTFMNTLMFGQKVKDFFTDLTDSDKKEIFRKVLTLDNYVLYYNQTKKELESFLRQEEEYKSNINALIAVIKQIEELIIIDRKRKIDFEENKEKELNSINLESLKVKESLKNIENDLQKYDGIEEKFNDIKNNILKTQDELSVIESKMSKELEDLESRAKTKEQEVTNQAVAMANEVKTNYLELIKKETESIKIKLKEVQSLKEELDSSYNKNFSIKVNFESSLSILRKDIEEINKNIIDQICPTCLQKINAEAKEKLRTSKSEKLQILNDLEPKLSVVKKELVEIQNRLVKNSQEKHDLENSIKQIESTMLEKQESELEEWRQKLRNAKQKISDIKITQKEEIENKYKNQKVELNETLSQLNRKKMIIEREVQDFKNLLNNQHNFTTTLAVLKDKYERTKKQSFDSQEPQLSKQIENKTNDLNNLNNGLENILNNKSILEFWKDGFSPSGIPSMLVDEAIPFMNRTMADYLDKLTNGRYIVSFDTLSTTKSGEFRDKISVNLLDTYTQSNTRGQFSGGQTRLVDIATILTLGDLQFNIQNMFVNILLFDEIFDSLDSENVENVTKVLNKIKDKRSIYIISHTHQDIEVDNILLMKK